MQEGKIKRGRRDLAWASYGDPAGKPVFYLHGAPASRLLHPGEELCKELGVRLITMDRPGYGLSTYYRKRKLLDLPQDLAALADSLGYERFTLVGASAGGPYVAACAYAIPERILAAGMCSSFGPLSAPGALKALATERKIGAYLALYAPWLSLFIVWSMRNPGRDPEAFGRRYTSHTSAGDKALLEDPHFGQMLLGSYRESARSGVRGFCKDVELLCKPWGFELSEIKIPIELWHAELDTSTPMEMAEYMSKEIPICNTHFVDSGDHFLLFTRWSEILPRLLELAS